MMVKEEEDTNMKMNSLDEWINDMDPIFKEEIKTMKYIEKHSLFRHCLKPKIECNQNYLNDITREINSLNKKLKIASQLVHHERLFEGIFKSDSYLDFRATLDTACYFLGNGHEVKLDFKVEPSDPDSKHMDVSIKLKERFVHFECYHPNIKEKDPKKIYGKGEQDYVNKSLNNRDLIRQILEKVNKRQIIKGKPNIFLIDVSDTKLEPPEGKTIDRNVVKHLVKRGIFNNYREYSAIVVFDRTQGVWVIPHPNPKLPLTDEEFPIIGREINL